MLHRLRVRGRHLELAEGQGRSRIPGGRAQSRPHPRRRDADGQPGKRRDHGRHRRVSLFFRHQLRVDLAINMGWLDGRRPLRRAQNAPIRRRDVVRLFRRRGSNRISIRVLASILILMGYTFLLSAQYQAGGLIFGMVTALPYTQRRAAGRVDQFRLYRAGRNVQQCLRRAAESRHSDRRLLLRDPVSVAAHGRPFDAGRIAVRDRSETHRRMVQHPAVDRALAGRRTGNGHGSLRDHSVLFARQPAGYAPRHRLFVPVPGLRRHRSSDLRAVGEKPDAVPGESRSGGPYAGLISASGLDRSAAAARRGGDAHAHGRSFAVDQRFVVFA